MFRLPALFAASAAVASAATSGTSGDLLSASWRSSEEAEFVVVAHESLADWKRQEESDGGGILLAGMKRDGIGEGSSNDDGHALFRSMLDSLERVPVTYLNGQRSVCFLPPPPEAVAAASKKAAARAAQEQAAAAAASGAAETDADKAAAVAARLRRFEGKCATMPDGYWHYAVCPFDKVRQFHPNPKGKPTSEFNLGTFNSTESMEVPSFLARRGGDFSAYTQKFSGGTDGRETQVHYVCSGSALDPSPERHPTDTRGAIGASKAHGPLAIAKVEEDPQHVYHITMVTSEICGVSESPQQLIAGAPTDCLRHVGAWWTAEICPFRRVRQYHKEHDGSRTEISLGVPKEESGVLVATPEQAVAASHNLRRYLLASNQNTGPEAQARVDAMVTSVGGDPLPYFEEVFTSGSPCGAGPNAPRRATVVRYFCDGEDDEPSSVGTPLAGGGDDGDNGADFFRVESAEFRSIDGFKEVAECLYKVDLRLPELCLHPAFQHQRNTPSDAPTLSKINCVPADDLEVGASPERAASA